MTKEGAAREPNGAADLDPERIEHITTVVLGVLERLGGGRRPPKPPWKRAAQFVLDHWGLCAFGLSVLAIGIASYLYEASPLYPFKQIAVSDQELDRRYAKFRFQRRMAESYVQLGNKLMDVGKYEDAAPAFEQAIELDEASIDASFGLMKAELFKLSAADEYDAAVIHHRLGIILENDPSDPHAHTRSGDWYLSRGEIEAAREEYETALSHDERLGEAHNGLASIYILSGDFTSAVEALERATEIAPLKWEYRLNLAEARLRKGDIERALEDYEVVSSVDPDALQADLGRASTYRLVGDLEKAVEAQRFLVEGLESAELAELPKNAGRWFFLTEDHTVSLHDRASKLAYAYHGLASTLFLLDRNQEANSYLARMPSLAQTEAVEVVALVNFDLGQLASHHESLAPSIDRYLKLHLKPSR